jgi:quercetin dioxygenase-like cupin family protein
MNKIHNIILDTNSIMRTKSETFQFEKTLQWETPGPGLRRQIMAYDGQLMMVKVHFEKGAVGTMHQHYHSQATYVVSGSFKLRIGDRTEILGPGDGYYVAPDELHGCVCLEEGVLIDTFSPVRADFLKL